MDMPRLDARVRLYDDASGRATKLLAFAELIIQDAFVIKGIRVLKREDPADDEPFVVFPAEKGKGAAADRWYDIAHPVSVEARSAASSLILDKWRQAGGAVKAAARA